LDQTELLLRLDDQLRHRAACFVLALLVPESDKYS
jgi:hypothetical protein